MKILEDRFAKLPQILVHQKTVHAILRNKKFKSYTFKRVQELEENYPNRRPQFCDVHVGMMPWIIFNSNQKII